MRRFYVGFLALALSAMLTMSACGGSSTTKAAQASTPGTVYVTGSDAPLPSVVGFQVTLNAITLSDGTNTYQVLTEPTTVDFSRLLGLRTLLGLNEVAAGTYTSATLTLANPVISYLDVTTTPPSVKTINGCFGTQGTTTTTLPIALNPNLTVGSNGLGGLHMHLNLHDSIVTDGSGEITGNVLPQIQMRVLKQTDEDRQIDELLGGVVSTDANNNNFIMQRWHGRNVTVKVDTNTQWSGEGATNWNLSSLQQGYTVEISGTVQGDGSILADAVEIVSIDKFYLGGLVLQVIPPAGEASNFTMFVRTEMPDVPGVAVPGTATLNVDTTTRFDIRKFNLPVEAFLFNRSMMVVGQRVGVAGIINPDNTLSLKRVALRRQGVEGKPVHGSVQIGATNKEGSFMLQNDGMFGYILGGSPIKVTTSQMTKFSSALPNGLQDLKTLDGRVILWGVVLKDGSGEPVFVAGYVTKAN